jgi:hypothetical protein
MYYLFTFEFSGFEKQYVMTEGDARRYAAVTDARIIRALGAEMIGQVEVDDVYGQPDFVYRDEYNRLITRKGSEITQWQKDHLLPLEEPIII